MIKITLSWLRFFHKKNRPMSWIQIFPGWVKPWEKTLRWNHFITTLNALQAVSLHQRDSTRKNTNIYEEPGFKTGITELRSWRSTNSTPLKEDEEITNNFQLILLDVKIWTLTRNVHMNYEKSVQLGKNHSVDVLFSFIGQLDAFWNKHLSIFFDIRN